MGDLSPHFNRWEFACKCGKCTPIAVDYKLVKELEFLRMAVDNAITITSGYRCKEHNEVVQKAANPKYVPCSSKSKHMFGIAADIKVKGWSPAAVYNLLAGWHPDTYGLKEYSSWVHFDVRKHKWRGKRP